MSYTSGPWEAGWYKGIPTVFDSHGNGTIRLATVHDLTCGDEWQNAKLMAAAPELLRACQEVVELLDSSKLLKKHICDIIAKCS